MFFNLWPSNPFDWQKGFAQCWYCGHLGLGRSLLKSLEMALNNTFYFWHAPAHRLDMCEFTSDCCEDLALALTTCNTLKSLNLDWNLLEHSGMEVLCDALNHKDCKLKMLGCVHTVSHG